MITNDTVLLLDNLLEEVRKMRDQVRQLAEEQKSLRQSLEQYVLLVQGEGEDDGESIGSKDSERSEDEDEDEEDDSYENEEEEEED